MNLWFVAVQQFIDRYSGARHSSCGRALPSSSYCPLSLRMTRQRLQLVFVVGAQSANVSLELSLALPLLAVARAREREYVCPSLLSLASHDVEREKERERESVGEAGKSVCSANPASRSESSAKF